MASKSVSCSSDSRACLCEIWQIILISNNCTSTLCSVYSHFLVVCDPTGLYVTNMLQLYISIGPMFSWIVRFRHKKHLLSVGRRSYLFLSAQQHHPVKNIRCHENTQWFHAYNWGAILANKAGKCPDTTLKISGFQLKIVPMYCCKYPQTWLYNSNPILVSRLQMLKHHLERWSLASQLFRQTQLNNVLLQLTWLENVPRFLVENIQRIWLLEMLKRLTWLPSRPPPHPPPYWVSSYTCDVNTTWNIW